MTYETRKVSQLVRWEGNPRPSASPEKSADLKASISDKGVILPLVVRHASGPKTGAKRIDEVIAGDTRRLLVAQLVAEGVMPADYPIPVIVRDDLVGKDAGALDVALSENIHVPMHPMDQFSAFMRMVDLGSKVEDIATAYGVKPRIVEQRLSYAKLDPRARELVKDGVRDLEWASAMTMASPAEQAAMLVDMGEDPRRYATVHDVRRYLDDELVPTSLALFGLDGVAESLVRKDLFDVDGATYMTRAEFQPLQDSAVRALADVRRGEGWSRVTIVGEREFDRYRYVDGVTDRERGEVVFVRHANGSVAEHAGLALRVEERVKHVDEADDQIGDALFSGGGNDDAAETLEPIGRTMPKIDPRTTEGRKTERYVTVSRAVIMQAALMQDPRLSVATTVAGLLLSAAPKPVEGRVFGDMKEMDPASPARIIVERRLDATRQIMAAGGIDPSLPYGEIVDRLLKLDDAQLMTLLQTSIAKRVTTDMSRGDMLFDAAMGQPGATLGAYWRPDRTYLGTLSKGGLEALAIEILPPRMHAKITGSKPDLVETIAQIVDDAHEGGMRLGEDERAIVTSWAPKSLGGVAPYADGGMFGDDAGASEDGSTDGGDDDDAGKALFKEAA